MLSQQAEYLFSEYEKVIPQSPQKKISVNSVLSKVASLYEKLRTAMEFQEDEVVLRSSIERILKRKLILNKKGELIAEPLLKELIWGGYFPDASLPETVIAEVSDRIDLYLKLQETAKAKHKNHGGEIQEWILHLLSSDIEFLINTNKKKELLSSFIFQFLKNKITIEDDSVQTKDVQLFIAVKRSFDRYDTPLLRYNLFNQLFGKLNQSNLETTAASFLDGIKEVKLQLSYPLQYKIYDFVKDAVIPFFILQDVFDEYKKPLKHLAYSDNELHLQVMDACQRKYEAIKKKVHTSILRSVAFILITKALFAFFIEGSIEKFLYGNIQWVSMGINVVVPPMLMVLAGSLINTPKKTNSTKILNRIEQILFDPDSQDLPRLSLKLNSTTDPLFNKLFIVLWFLAFVISFGSIITILSKLHFTYISQFIFLSFIAIVSFITYRIYQKAHIYTIDDKKQDMRSLLFDFYFLPFIHMGRQLTEGISKINIILLLIDFIIEAPFKMIFSFFEQWFTFLRSQRERLG